MSIQKLRLEVPTTVYTLLKIGKSNWDYYLTQPSKGKPYVMSVAKSGTGCEDCVFGSLEYYHRMDEDLSL